MNIELVRSHAWLRLGLRNRRGLDSRLSIAHELRGEVMHLCSLRSLLLFNLLSVADELRCEVRQLSGLRRLKLLGGLGVAHEMRSEFGLGSLGSCQVSRLRDRELLRSHQALGRSIGLGLHLRSRSHVPWHTLWAHSWLWCDLRLRSRLRFRCQVLGLEMS